MKSDTLNGLSLKYQMFTPLGCTDIGSQKIEFVAKTPFLFQKLKKSKNQNKIYMISDKLLRKNMNRIC